VVDLAPHQATAKVVLLGQARSIEEVRATVSRFSDVENAEAALELIKDYWQGVLGAIQIQTPDPALDLLMNRWLLYQVLSCRVYARASFYQSGGAYGFRDQLQDVMALVYANLMLRANTYCERQDDNSRGRRSALVAPALRTWIENESSDDAIWLPYVSSFYVDVTGDLSILDEKSRL
jgi:cyclic beta-1,2-glucan synthetase